MKAKFRRQCDGKERISKESLAALAAERATTSTKTRIVHYRCRACGNWHIGHPPGVFRNASAEERDRLKSSLDAR